MQRKWRTNRGALDSVTSFPDFRASLPPRGGADDSLADPVDLYAVYTVLHIENKRSELRWSAEGRFYFFLARWEQAAGAGQAAAPEGDEDPPAQVVPEGSEAALQQQANASAAGGGKGSGGKKGKQQRQQQRQQQQQLPNAPAEPAGQPDPQPASGLPAVAPAAEAAPAAKAGAEAAPAVEAAAEAAPAAEAVAQAAPAAEAGSAGAPAAQTPRLRTQIVVPVSSACRQLTPRLLQRLFAVRGVQAQQLLLALVDSNGVVTRSCLYNYIQAPLEGPGSANLELLDD